jgi:hypothetical protein
MLRGNKWLMPVCSKHLLSECVFEHASVAGRYLRRRSELIIWQLRQLASQSL